MNCIDKMYKEVEEILKKEELEKVGQRKEVKEIKFDFLNTQDDNQASLRDFYSEIVLDETKSWKKYYLEKRVKDFIIFVFNKYLCLYSLKYDKPLFDKLCESVKGYDKSDDEFYKDLPKFIDNFLSIPGVENDEATEGFFLNPYNALLKDDQGIYAVIEGKRFSDISKPNPLNPNQVKKCFKEMFDLYLEEYKPLFNNDKEYNSFSMSLKADVNKAGNNHIDTQTACEDKIFEYVSKKGVSRESFDLYIYSKGLRIKKQGEIYFREREIDTFNNYKKIEFRY